jgi:SpoU rRNA methylase family enzyme
MALEFDKRIKELDEYVEVLKHELLFLMAERKLRPESAMNQKIITIKRELDKAVQERMRLSQICYGNVNRIVVTATA